MLSARIRASDGVILDSYRKILLLPMCGFGDAVCYLPFLQAVREHFPQAEIACVVVSQPARAVLEAGVDNVTVIVFNRSGQQRGWRSLLDFLHRLRRYKFDVAVSGAHPDSPRIPLVTALSGAKIRIGAKTERLSFLYNRLLDIRTDSHAYERFRLLLTGLGIDLSPDQYQPAVQPSPSGQGGAAKLWAEAGLDKSSIVIGLASGADTNSRGPWKPYLKRWKPERYAELVRWITQEAGGQAVMFGGPEERALAEQITATAGVPIVDFCGKTGIQELPWLLQMCTALVTNDTGVMHMAAAVGTPVVALFGPTSPLGFAPTGALVVQGKIHCSPCYPYPTCDLKGCGAMDDISVARVKDSLMTTLNSLKRKCESREIGAR
jgi:ADP-heptose:LPS heptosyltransferase